jgi:hypothetical protein
MKWEEVNFLWTTELNLKILQKSVALKTLIHLKLQLQHNKVFKLFRAII